MSMPAKHTLAPPEVPPYHPLPRRGFLRAGGLAALATAVSPRLARGLSSGKRRVKIGQIGTGHAHAAGKMSTLRKLQDEYEVVGIVEPDPELKKRAENQAPYRGLAWLTEEQLLNVEGLEAVAVETRVCDLVPTAARCVSAGKHLHLDKPAGESLSAYRQLLEDASQRRLTVQMGFMFRHNPAFRLCFQAVRDGWLGEVFEVHGVISSKYAPAKRKGLVRYRGGTMFELGCHLIDAVVTALGKPDAVAGFARRVHSDWDDLADNQLAVFEYPKATATVRSTLLEVDSPQRRQFVVCGDQGTIDIRPLEPPCVQVTLAGARGRFKRGCQTIDLPAMPGRYDDHLIELARIIRGEKDPEYLPSHDLAVHEAVLRASGLPTGEAHEDREGLDRSKG